MLHGSFAGAGTRLGKSFPSARSTSATQTAETKPLTRNTPRWYKRHHSLFCYNAP